MRKTLKRQWYVPILDEKEDRYNGRPEGRNAA
jgi:hypothetical protein